MDQPFRLAIDLGTTHTVAVIRRDHHQPARTLLFDGTPLLASAVFVTPDGTVHTGRDAVRLGGTDPQRYEPHPKRRVDDSSLLLGTDEVPVERLLTATLRRVADEARTAGVDPTAATVLTCPADWGHPRRTLLRTAAQHAGLGPVHLLDEPVAAATYCAQILHHQLPTGGSLGIFDFGGGTLDVTVIRRDPGGLRVLATGGLDDLGGLDIDDALVAHLGHLIELRDPEQWRRLRHPETPAERRDRQAFWAEVRAAKEMLSRTASAPVQVPGRDDPLHLTRDELDRVAGPLVARAVDETRRTLHRAGVEPNHLTSLLLVGGSSRLPLVASRLHARLRIAPAVPEQPELPVAYGAIHTRETTPHPAGPQPFPGRPTNPVPGTPGYPPTTSAPSGHPPLPPQPTRVPTSAPTTRPAPAPTPRRRRIRRLLAVTTAFVTVAGCVGTTIAGGDWLRTQLDNLGAPAAAPDPVGTLKQVNAHSSTRTGAASVTVAADDVISAVAGNGATEVLALPATDAPPRWKSSVPIEPAELRLTVQADLIILDGERSVTDNGLNVRAVLRATDGKLLWKRTWVDRVDVAYYGTDVVVETKDHDSPTISRIDLRTGKQEWARSAERDLLVLDEHRAEPMRLWPTGDTAPAAVLPPTAGVFTDSLAATTTVVELDSVTDRGYLLNATTGKVMGSGALPLDTSLWTAHDDVVVGKTTTDAREVLAAYRGPRFTRVWTLPLQANERIERVKPCGAHRVCVAIAESGGDYHLRALDTRSGAENWRAATESSDEDWYIHGDTLVSGDAPFDTIRNPKLLDATNGKERRALPRLATLEAANGGRMAVSTAAPAGDSVTWRLHVEEMATNRGTGFVNIGAGKAPPERIVIAGDLIGVLTGDRQTLALRISGLD